MEREEGKPFSVKEALAAGITRQMLRGGRYKQVLRSVYVRAEVAISPRVRAEAALVLVPAGVLSHHTALELWGGSGPVDGQLHVSVRRDPNAVLPRVRGLQVHEVQELEVGTSAGLRLTPPIRTFIDLASCCRLSDLVTAGESLVRHAGSSPEAFIETATSAVGVRGIRLAREAAALVRRGVDSPMESRLRLLLVLAGLPEPEVGRPVYSADGGWIAQPDLSYPALKIAIEYDGRHHLQDARQWQRDIAAARTSNARVGWSASSLPPTYTAPPKPSSPESSRTSAPATTRTSIPTPPENPRESA